jgi:hypothetical protein
MLLKSSLQLKNIAIASSAIKTRLSIDTDFEIYLAIIARTKIFIPEDDFIVHRGDINNPGYWSSVIGGKWKHAYLNKFCIISMPLTALSEIVD